MIVSVVLSCCDLPCFRRTSAAFAYFPLSPLVSVYFLRYARTYFKKMILSHILLFPKTHRGCRNFKPKYISMAEKLIAKYKDVEVYAVSCAPHKDICNKHKISGYPVSKDRVVMTISREYRADPNVCYSFDSHSTPSLPVKRREPTCRNRPWADRTPPLRLLRHWA